MLQWAKSMYGEQSEGMQNLQRCRMVPLLVIDEIFAAPSSYTDHAKGVIGDLLATRFDRGAATLFTSNELPIFGSIFDNNSTPDMQRLQSRFEGSTAYVSVKEHVDLRRQ